MRPALTFVIPVRHQDNANNWAQLKANLSATAASIAAQDDRRWNAVIVANHGAELPQLPQGFDVCRVDFSPNQIHQQGGASKEDFYNAFRIDKGRRVLAGMLHARDCGHFMIVDDDDFVSRKLAGFVANNPRANGWFLRDGYIWSTGGRLLYLHSDFSKLCGTSHIIRSDLYQLPNSFGAADDEYIRRMLGSHIYLHEHLDATGHRLSRLPFPGAVYRTGHAGAHSQSSGILGQFFFKSELLRRPFELSRRLRQLRVLNGAFRREFFALS